MENQFEVVLIGPVKHNGKRKNIGATIMVTADELRALVKAKAVAANELTQLDDPDNTAKSDVSDHLLTTERDEAVKKAGALQSLNEELVNANRDLKAEVMDQAIQLSELQSKLDAAETDKGKLAEEITKADLAIEALKTEMSGEGKEDTEAKPAAKAPAKSAAKTARVKPTKN